MSTDDVKVRKALPTDGNDLLKICQLAFPDSLRWSDLFTYGHEWWQFGTNSPAANIWVASKSEVLTGVIVTVHNEDLWNEGVRKLKTRLQFRPILLKLPYLAWKRYTNQHPPLPLDQNKFDLRKPSNNRIFIELTAVSPQFQRMGIGNRLDEIAENQAISESKKAVARRVNHNNEANLTRLLKNGYQIVASGNKQYTLEKSLTSN